MRQAEILAEGLVFGESPRWHDERLWVSDFRRREVLTVDMDGNIEPVVDVPDQPSGLGWLPDGRLLIVSMHERKLLRLDPDGLVEHADLSDIANGHCNDMVVDGKGRAWVGNFGFDAYAYTGGKRITVIMNEDPNYFLTAEDLPTATLAQVNPDGSVRPAAADLRFPNGTVITPDGTTLIVAETFDPCLTAFDVAPEGILSNRRVWAQFEQRYPTVFPDGLCLDAEGAVWVADAMSSECVRVAEGGEILDRVSVSASCVACTLGGPDRKTLFLIANQFGENPSGRVEIAQVDVPGAGLP